MGTNLINLYTPVGEKKKKKVLPTKCQLPKNRRNEIENRHFHELRGVLKQLGHIFFEF